MQSLEELIKDIETKYPKWYWLVKLDKTEGYFANIYNDPVTSIHHCYGPTPFDALRGSLSALEGTLHAAQAPNNKVCAPKQRA